MSDQSIHYPDLNTLLPDDETIDGENKEEKKETVQPSSSYSTIYMDNLFNDKNMNPRMSSELLVLFYINTAE